MNEKTVHTKSILLLGSIDVSYSIAVCLLQGGHDVQFCTDDTSTAKAAIALHLSDLGEKVQPFGHITYLETLNASVTYDVAIVVSKEDAARKKQIVTMLEQHLSPRAILALNTESIGLDVIQGVAKHPDRIIGLNWAEPAHTTRFLEIIKNHCTSQKVYDTILALSGQWKKDPYTVENCGVRSQLLSALIREAFYLVDNGYASVEDIDRACRNDAGYYLPFAGNCRYMDLMGTYAYGMVMKDLNPDLSTETSLPAFFKALMEGGALGIENGKGFYTYTPQDVAYWRNLFRNYCYQIEKVMNKYPFNYKQDGTQTKTA